MRTLGSRAPGSLDNGKSAAGSALASHLAGRHAAARSNGAGSVYVRPREGRTWRALHRARQELQ